MWEIRFHSNIHIFTHITEYCTRISACVDLSNQSFIIRQPMLTCNSKHSVDIFLTFLVQHPSSMHYFVVLAIKLRSSLIWGNERDFIVQRIVYKLTHTKEYFSKHKWVILNPFSHCESRYRFWTLGCWSNYSSLCRFTTSFIFNSWIHFGSNRSVFRTV